MTLILKFRDFRLVQASLSLFFVFTFAAKSLPAFADEDILRAEFWFNRLKTISADFTQIASDGTSSQGKIFFRRPSRMKIIYGNGEKLNLITTPIWLHVDRPSDRTLVSYPIEETPLAVILTKTVKFKLDGYKTSVLSKSGGVLAIEILKVSGEGAGRLILEFSQKPFALRRWIVVDGAGIETSFTLQNTAFDKALENSLFSVPSYDN